jgi:probable phosphoglycerate mutase
MIPAIPFYMIRHGESEANLGQFASGHKDVALTSKGWEQASAAADLVKRLSIRPAVIIHSHLQRARNTAKILNDVIGAPMIEDPRIAEQHYGDWEGQSWNDVRQPIRDGIDPPNGETHAAFVIRVQNAITSFIETHPGPIMIVCHGGVFGAFRALYNLPREGVENCVLHYFEPETTNEAFPWTITRHG